MNNIRYYIFLFLLIPISSWAQMSVQDAQNPPFTPRNLISDIFLGDGVEVVNITYEGNPASIGFFSEGGGVIGLDEGIMLTTGVVESFGANQGIIEDGSVQSSVDNGSSVVDVDANSISSATVLNLTKYTIEFIPSTDRISFNYVFASEEYPEFVCSDYSDIFGLFISGPGITGSFSNGGVNIAQIPGSNLPVTINNVNGGVVGSQGNASNCNGVSGSLNFAQFYNDNDGSSLPPVYDGFLNPFTAEADVIPCEVYTLKIVIADQGDEQRDSGVFLEAKSLSSSSVQASITTSSLDGFIVEGCEGVSVTFTIDEPASTDTEIELNFIDSATPGVDFEDVPNTLTIPAGQTSVDAEFTAIEDGLDDDVELIGIDFRANLCSRDTFYLGIRDNILFPPAIDNKVICGSESVELNGTIDLDPVEEITFNSTDVNLPIISPPPTGSPSFQTISELNVTGLGALSLNPALIQSVCLDIQHTRVQDLDIYLFAPNGAFVPLSLNNGGEAANYSNTCFTPDAASDICVASAPFTGDFLPEGNLNDIAGSSVNGLWKIMIVDNVFGFNGILNDWSITFNSTYNWSYSWTPAAGLSCTDCPSTMANPSTTTTYTLEIVDIYGCIATETVLVEVAAGTLTSPVLNCTEVSDNSVTIEWDEIPGATEYVIDVDNTGPVVPNNGSTSHTIINLTQGQTISAVVTASNDCESEMSMIDCTTNSCDIMVSQDVIDLDCDGNLGSISIIVQGGTYPYTYEWVGLGITDSVATDLAPGMYTINVSDATANCAASVSATILDYTTMTFTVESTPTCFGMNEGTATILVSGGNGAYSYQWGDTADNQTTMQATNLVGGIHAVTVTDESNCEIETTIEVAENDILADISIFCASVTSSTITFAWSEVPGAPAYELNIDGAGWTPVADPSILEQTLMGLSLGQTIDIEVRVVGGCNTVSDMVSCTTNDCTPIDLMETHTDINCFGDGNGEITITAVGSNGPFSFTLMQQTNDTGIFSNLSGGNYTILVEDQLSCTASINVMIDEPNELLSNSVVINNVDCINEFGNATVEVSGGTSPFLYSWSNGSADSLQSDLVEGDYTVTITDAGGCSQENSLTITGFVPIVLQTTSTPSNCGPMPSGTATVDAVGGSGTYTYLWNDAQNQTTSTASDLAPGQYEVIVEDSDGCIETSIVNVSTPSMLQIDDSIIVSLLCNGDASASIELIVTGGSGTYQYLWNDANSQTSATATNLAAGDYAVEIMDDMGCLITAAFTIDDPAPIQIDGVSQDVFCPGDPSGEITVSPSGGAGGYEFMWSNGGSTTATNQNLIAGSYTVTVTDANGCTIEEAFEVIGASGLDIDLMPSDATCVGSDGLVQTNVVGGTPGYTYAWSTGSTDANLDNLGADTYTLTITDAMNCSIIDSVSISAPTPIVGDAFATTTTCAGGRDGTISIEMVDGTAPFTYALSSGAESDLPMFQNLEAGTYDVILIDSFGCSKEISTVIIDQPSPIEISVDSDLVIDLGDEININANVFGGTPEYTYLWSGLNVEQLDCIDCEDPSGLLLNSSSFTLTVADANGCTEDIFLSFSVRKNFDFYAPTAFSPNRDGVNDIFTLFGTEGTIVNNFEVYSRWGEKIFSHDIDFEINELVGWDGTFRAERPTSDIFTWYAKITFIDGTQKVVSGEFTLIK